ncbi:class I SAM-dependent DNA methyltransferase, partial [Natrinema soli]
DAETPCSRIRAALRESSVEWAVLTNGRRWRLYTGRTGHRLDAYYEIDLPTMLGTGDLEAFKYFYLFFRRDAFRDDAEGDCLLDDHYDRSAEFTREMGATLEENATDALESLARGFRRYPGNDLDDLSTDDLDVLYDASLVVLVRLLIAFAAERRGRRSTEPSGERRDGESDTGPAEPATLRSIARSIAAEFDGSNPSYSDRAVDLWSRLEEVGSPIGRRSRSDELPSVPIANGRPFRTDPAGDDSPVARFLETHRVGDASLATAIDLLARRRADGGGSKPFIDYSPLDGRRLGEIYEGLLEYRL